jgi:hypothetical protein
MRLVERLPRRSQKAVIQLKPQLQVSCLIPEGPQEFFGGTIRLPNMLAISQIAFFHGVETVGTSSHGDFPHRYLIYECAPGGKQGEIKGRPLRVGNAFDQSRAICWGSNPYPVDLRAAMTQFFSSGFDYNPGTDYSPVKKDEKGNYFLPPAVEQEDITKIVLGEGFIAIHPPIDALFLSSDPSDIELAGQGFDSTQHVGEPGQYYWNKRTSKRKKDPIRLAIGMAQIEGDKYRITLIPSGRTAYADVTKVSEARPPNKGAAYYGYTSADTW